MKGMCKVTLVETMFRQINILIIRFQLVVKAKMVERQVCRSGGHRFEPQLSPAKGFKVGCTSFSPKTCGWGIALLFFS